MSSSSLFDQLPDSSAHRNRLNGWDIALLSASAIVATIILIGSLVFFLGPNNDPTTATALPLSTATTPPPQPAASPVVADESASPEATVTETPEAAPTATPASPAPTTSTSAASPRESTAPVAPSTGPVSDTNAADDSSDESEDYVLEDPPLDVVIVPDDGAASSTSLTVIPSFVLDGICQAAGFAGAEVPAGATEISQVSCAGAGGPVGFDQATLHDNCPSGTVVVQDQAVLCRVDS